jgi:hypothetical protein
MLIRYMLKDTINIILSVLGIYVNMTNALLAGVRDFSVTYKFFPRLKSY